METSKQKTHGMSFILINEMIFNPDLSLAVYLIRMVGDDTESLSRETENEIYRNGISFSKSILNTSLISKVTELTFGDNTFTVIQYNGGRIHTEETVEEILKKLNSHS